MSCDDFPITRSFDFRLKFSHRLSFAEIAETIETPAAQQQANSKFFGGEFTLSAESTAIDDGGRW